MGTINNLPTSLIFDTGSSVTIIDMGTLNLNKIKPIKEVIILETANRIPLKVIGSAIIIIVIKAIKIEHECLVVNKLHSPPLIGLDIIKKLKTILNFKNNILSLKSDKNQIILVINTSKIEIYVQQTNINNNFSLPIQYICDNENEKHLIKNNLNNDKVVELI